MSGFKAFMIKVKDFCLKFHLQYLAMAILLYGFKAGLYFLIANTSDPNNYIMFNMEIDNLIPFIPYFYVFYLSYYILPEIFLWMLSFYNKRKVFDLVIGAAVVNILCCICFLIQQVKMDRAPFEAIVSPYKFGDGSITNFEQFFYAAVHFQYDADETALNCFPSLHATFGTMLFLIGVPTLKGEKHFPLWARIFCGVFGIGIVLSTFFVKQHYFVDAIAGMTLMIGSYYLTHYVIGVVLKHREEKKVKAAV